MLENIFQLCITKLKDIFVKSGKQNSYPNETLTLIGCPILYYIQSLLRTIIQNICYNSSVSCRTQKGSPGDYICSLLV